MALFQNIHKNGNTVIIVTHEEDIAQYTHRIIRLKDGEVASDEHQIKTQKMKIYTKKGDSGTTQLIGGTRVAKSHQRINAYGTIDELNSYIGLVRDQTDCAKSKLLLIDIQDRLCTIGALLASDPIKTMKTSYH